MAANASGHSDRPASRSTAASTGEECETGPAGRRSYRVWEPPAALGAGVLLALKASTIGRLPLVPEVALSIVVLAMAFWTVFIVLRHAEAIAHRIGEPYGTLVLTVAVTAIEASVIVTVMLGGVQNPALVRESVFSTVMIVCGGILGICLTLGGLRHTHQDLQRQGTSALLAVVVALSAARTLPSPTTRASTSASIPRK